MSDASYARLYGVLTAVLTVLTFMPYEERGVSVWNITSRDSNIVGLGRSSVFLTLILAAMLLVLTIRPATSAAAGWTLGALALIVGSVNWAYVAHLKTPAPSAFGTVVLCFAAAFTGCAHAVRHHRTGTHNAR